jgi:hypothetical protein
MAALVRTDKTTQRLYVHEVALRSEVQASAFKTEALTAKDDALNGADARTIKRIIQEIYSVNPSDVSNKLATLPAIKAVLENGAYLGHLPDLTGKSITNHYFAAGIHRRRG